jgi:type III pantothenate kinase
LGADRIALVAGAIEIYDKQNVLVIDAGTCITYDFITAKNEYLGGGISPGMGIRFRSLNTFTQKLPLIEYREEFQLIGKNTENSILSGVLNGVICEIDGIIEKYKENFGELQIILSGGNTIFFDKRLKNNIFAFPKLLLYGLNSILNYNAQN